ncbi:MAG: FecR family protein [Spirochaetales bacterium]
MKKSLTVLLVLLAFLPGVLTAQTAKAPAVVLVFAGDDPSLITIKDSNGKQQVANEGLKMQSGWIITTAKGGSAELQIKPNGSIIKIASSTTFKINDLNAGDGKTKNDFEIASGKIRAVAAKLAGKEGEPGYSLKTPTANCGVRGTDFIINIDGAQESLVVAEGLVDFTKDATGELLQVGAGQMADALAATFNLLPLDQSALDAFFSDVGFIKLDPAVVNALVAQAVSQQADVGDVNTDKGKTTDTGKAEAKPAEPAKDDPILAWIKKVLGAEIGSVTIDGQTWSKAILQPVIDTDGFRLGLYLPIIYKSDMFNPDDWYKPAGNSEWSFGTDQTGWLNIGLDAVSDLVLKIRFLELGRQGVDPFYLKIGNLNTMSIGHGTVMSHFANDQEFPSVRKVGLNAGVTLGPIGLEGVADDLGSPQVVGGRLSLNVVGNWVVFGVGGIADLALVDPKGGKIAADYGNPILIVGGLDTQWINLDIGVLRALVFADANVLTAWYQNAYTANGVTVAQGLALGTVIDSKGVLRSYGAEAGVTGKILGLVDYRLAFQLENGLYTNQIFRSNYYRTRAEKLTALNSYLTDTTYAATVDKLSTVGIFGSTGFNILNILKFEGAYRWPMSLDSTGKIVFSPDGTLATVQDSLAFKLEIPKGALPDFIKLSGAVSYERTKFVSTLAQQGTSLNLFDANTVLKGEILYGVVQGVDLAIGVTTLVKRNADGTVVYETNGQPKILPTINLETRIGF